MTGVRPPARALRILAAMAVLVIPTIAFAQTPPRVTAGAPSPPAASTWRVSGRVLSPDGAPIRRAIVKITGGTLTTNRSAITDDQGRFSVDGVPAGRVTILASKPAYLATAFGAKAPGRAGTPLTVGPGAQLDRIEIRMPRGAVIAGTVRGASGEPIPNAQVLVLRRAALSPASQLNVSTNDQGEYRVYGLAPDTYLVGATASPTFSRGRLQVPTSATIDAMLQSLERQGDASAGNAPTFAFAPVFYPGVTTTADAAPLTLRTADERLGIDITLSPMPAVSVSGTISSPDGLMPPVLIELRPRTPLPFANFGGPTLRVAPGPSGQFEYAGITPGRYVLTVRSAVPAPSSAQAFMQMEKYGSGEALPPGLDPNVTTFATVDVEVSGADVSGIVLTLQPAWHARGRVTFDATTLTPPADLGVVNVTMPYVGGTGGVSMRANGAISGRIAVPPAHPGPDAMFDLKPVLPATYRIAATVPGESRWWLRSVIVNGQDVIDRPFDMTGDVSDAVVTFTDRHTELSGELQTPAGTPATDYFVVVFTTDRTLWRPQARRVVFARPATDGHFSLKDVPPGDYYLAALTDLDPATWQNAEFLDSVIPAALKISIAEGETKRQDLRLAQ